MNPLLSPPPPLPSAGSLDRLEDESASYGVDPAYLERALYVDAREFLARPGKAFRARLIQACFDLVGGGGAQVPAAALEAIELLHGGSLIVDDIQDDALTRRGAPALHRTIGTPRALNTGNWLYFVALTRLDALQLAPAVASDLSRAAHRCLMRCHEGQALDLALRVDELRRSDLPQLAHFISAHKTGALAGFAARLGGSLCQSAAATSVGLLHGLTSFGQRVGVALQMLDDLGSFVAEKRHDKAREDLLGKRPSWVWAWASQTLDEHTFRQLIKQLSRENELEALRGRLADAVEPLGRKCVRETLAQATRELGALFAPSDALAALHAELTHLEHSYG